MNTQIMFGCAIFSISSLAFAQSPPANDNCSNASEIYLGTTAFTTIDATTDGIAHPECTTSSDGGQTAYDVWYSYTVGASGTLAISTCNSVDYDSDIVAYLGDDCNNLTLLGCNDDGTGCSGYSSHLEVDVYFGERITIRVGSYKDTTTPGGGDIVLTLHDANGDSITAPENDDYTDAVSISEGDWHFTTDGATTDGDNHASCEVSGDGGETAHDIWYRYLAPASGTITLSTCDQANYDTDLVLYEDTGSALVLVACQDDTTGCGGYTSTLEAVVDAGNEYLFRVGGWSDGFSGTGILSVSLDAAAVTWIGSDGGSWFNQANWSSGVVPTAAVDIVISGHVDINQSGAVANSVTVQNGGELTLSTTSSSLTTLNLTVEAGGNLNWQGGTIDVSGGTIDVASDLSVGCSYEATLIAKESYINVAGELTVCEDGTLISTSWIFAEGLTNLGTIDIASVNSEIGYIWVFGDYNQFSSGTIIIDLNGAETAGTDYDYIAANGSTYSIGTLKIRSHDGFQPSHGEVFTVLDSTSATHDSSFSVVEPTSFNAGISFIQSSTSDGVSISAFVTPIIYVDADNASGDGTSWENAYPTLQEALVGAPVFSQIWVAEGIYTPGATREDTFTLQYFVSVFGGFEGNEINIHQRNIEAHPTILSGDINNTPNDTSDDAYHVVTAPLIVTTLDGLVITKGNANGNGTNQSIGGGIYQTYGAVSISNCTVLDNKATYEGAGVYVYGGSLDISNSHVEGNISSKQGGGIYSEQCSLTIDSTHFKSNRILRYMPLYAEGGGLHVDDGSLTLSNSVFDDNSAFFGLGIPDGGTGGALYARQCATVIEDTTFKNNRALNGGAVYFSENSNTQTAVINRCIFDNNYIFWNINPAYAGGAAFKSGGGVNSQTVLVNSLFSGNDGGETAIIDMGIGGGNANKIKNCTIAYNENVGVYAAVVGEGVFLNSILWRNTGSNWFYNQINSNFVISQSIIDRIPGGGHPGIVSTADPLFIAPRGPDGVFGTGDEDYRLLPESRAIDWGADTYYNPENLGATDLGGKTRLVNDPYTVDRAVPNVIDLGCYEFQIQYTGDEGFRSYKVNGGLEFGTDINWEPEESPSTNNAAFFPKMFKSLSFTSDESIQSLTMVSGIIDFSLGNHTVTVGAENNSVSIGAYDRDFIIEFGVVDGTIIAPQFVVSGNGQLYMDNSTIQTTGGLVLLDGGKMYGQGNIQGNVYNTGSHELDSVNNAYPSVTGDYYMTEDAIAGLSGSGSIAFNLQDFNNDGVISHISVSGTTTLGGVLSVLAGNGLLVGETATILSSSGGIVNNFDSILSIGFSADELPIVSTVANANGTGSSVVVALQSVSALIGFDDPDATNINALPKDGELADIDGDGYPDLVLSIPDDTDGNGDTDSIIILYNGGVDSNDNWLGFSGGTQQILVGDNPNGLTTADFDRDGDIDIAVVNTNDDTVSVLENETSLRGTVTFTKRDLATDYYGDAEAIEALPTDVTHGKFSNSGEVDLAIANSGDGRMVIINGPLFADRAMPGGSNHQTGGGAQNIDPGDVNNDKDFDKVTVTGREGQTTVFKGQTAMAGSTSYAIDTVLDMGNSISEQIVADFDNNGMDDLIVCDADNNSISIALQKLDGTYKTPALLSLYSGSAGGYIEPRSISTIDIDGDGDLDLAIVVKDENENVITAIFRNDTQEGTTTVALTDISQAEGIGLNPLMARSADIDNDGTADLLMVTDTIAYRSNTAAGSAQTVLNEGAENNTCPADFDGNGNVAVADLLVLIAAWGPGTGPEDLNGNGTVNVADLLLLIGAWGACP
ncbi:MAG: hypothetical protein HOM36_07280 [Phycisphaerae bacterium]|nr:hypothetical protein [Phycisphaerae bacterium]